MKTLLIALLGALAVSAASQADIIVDSAWVTQAEMTPTSPNGSFDKIPWKAIKVPYDDCPVLASEALAAMFEREIAKAREYGQPIHTDFAGGQADADPDGFKPTSSSECVRERQVVIVRVSVTMRPPIQCGRQYIPGFSWAEQYASADTCP